MKQSLKTCLPLGEGGCEQSEQTEGGMLHWIHIIENVILNLCRLLKIIGRI